MKQSKPLLIAALLLNLFSLDLSAASGVTWYQVELLIFLNKTFPSETGEASEFWPADPEAPDLDGKIELLDAQARIPKRDIAAQGTRTPVSATDEAPFSLLDRTELQLVEQRQRLGASRQYRVILHLAWRQPATARKSARGVLLQTPPGTRFLVTADALPAIAAEAEQTALSSTYPPTAPREGRDPLRAPARTGELVLLPLEGTASLWVARYLHLEVDLLYRRLATVPIYEDGNTTGAGSAVVPAGNNPYPCGCGKSCSRFA